MSDSPSSPLRRRMLRALPGGAGAVALPGLARVSGLSALAGLAGLFAGCGSIDRAPPGYLTLLPEWKPQIRAVRPEAASPSQARVSAADAASTAASGRPPTRAAISAAAERTLLVTPVLAGPLYDSNRIVFSRTPGRMQEYQHSLWAERPNRRIGLMLIDRLSQIPSLRAVASTGSGIAGRYVMNARLESLYHDAASEPGTAHAALLVELIDQVDRSLIGRQLLQADAPAQDYDAEGATQAMGRAVQQMLDRTAQWVQSALERR